MQKGHRIETYFLPFQTSIIHNLFLETEILKEHFLVEIPLIFLITPRIKLICTHCADRGGGGILGWLLGKT